MSKDRFCFTLLFTRFTLILKKSLHGRFTRFTLIKVCAGHSFTQSFTQLHAPQLHAPLHAQLHALHVDQGTRRSQLHARFTHSFTRPPSPTEREGVASTTAAPGATRMSPIRPENRNRYPANWREISLRIRTVRAAGRCECLGECGRDTHTGRCPNHNGSPAYGTGSKVVLTVAHLDHTPENVDETNLRAMCQGCHLHYDRDHHRHTAAATRRAAIEGAGQLSLTDPPPDPHRS